jgi:type I restriction enzyme R subunit
MISFKEDHISQIPALQLLQKLGYIYLTPDEVNNLRGGRRTQVLLEPILRKQLREINSIQFRLSKGVMFTDQNIENGIEALRKIPIEEGYISANEYIYNLLTLGKSLEQSIDGDKKSYNLHYIDWDNIENNVFHVAEEFVVNRTGMNDAYRPDIVLFVNGIPLGIIECKRPDLKESLEQSISQHLRNQKDDGIRGLYAYSALLLGIATTSSKYATTGTPEEFWSIWREQFDSKIEEENYNDKLFKLINTPLSDEKKDKLFNYRYAYVRSYFDEKEQQSILPCDQDKTIYNLCRPDRLLELLFSFTIYEDGVKKLARYQQYFVVKKMMQRIDKLDGGKRKGGVIWHTQGSGKSLTMVMLAQAIVLNKTIRNPKIILVTDRTDLDRQITATLKKCGTYAENATTGKNLTELLQSKSDAVITTVINKFETAVKGIKEPLNSPNIFVLVDEGHRTQYGELSIQMRKTLPNACFIAFTGTPLMKKEKNTASRFGGMITPVYTVNQAVEDKAVVPLLYEGRIVPLDVHEKPIDNYFTKISEPLTDYERIDLKKKFSRADQINQSDQRIYAIAWNISEHFKENWQETKFKGQLVCPLKKIAIKYKQFFDEIGIISTEVLITSPDTREGEDTAYGDSSSIVNSFWKKMMDEHGSAKKYEENLINRFKNNDKPEIIIVVDKLLTGFDEPKNTVLYIDRKLKEHTLLQAIARVNRVCEDKDFGFIIDYYGVLDPLNNALDVYSEFDPSDLDGTITDVSEEIKTLPQKYSELWDIFKSIANKRDLEAYAQLLRLEDIRQNFYDKLVAYTRTLKIALSSIDFHNQTPEDEIKRYKDDLAMFLKLRSSVQKRYSDNIDYKKYEGQIQKLINTHIESGEVKIVTDLVNIFDKEKFSEEVEKVIGKAAKADTIASRTTKHITEKMDYDPVFYKKFSELLKETIKAYEQGRIDEAEYLRRVTEQMNAVISRSDKNIPQILTNNNAARAYYGLVLEYLGSVKEIDMTELIDVITTVALDLDNIIKKHIYDQEQLIIEWNFKSNITGLMKIEMEDYLIDEVKRKYDIPLSFDDMDVLIEQCVKVANLQFK